MGLKSLSNSNLTKTMLIRTLGSLITTGTVLFISAGTLNWREGWFLLVSLYSEALILGFWLSKNDPGLLRERLKPLIQKSQERWDRFYMAGTISLYFIWIAVTALDVKRFQWTRVPESLQYVGGAAALFSMAVIFFAFRENTFAAPVVKIQEGRGHKVISTGPYRLVRHPMYTGISLLLLGAPLFLGSWWGVGIGAFKILSLGARAVGEEDTLKTKLEGYSQYCEKVHFRILPWVW